MPVDLEQLRQRRHSVFFLTVGCLIILALTLSVATRTFHLSVPHGVTVQSNAAQGMRQHMDSDAAQWVPPIQQHTIYEAVSFYPRVAPAGPPLPSQLFAESLYNRPPPSC